MPSALARPGMRVLKGVDADGRRVAWAWVGPVPSAEDGTDDTRWLYQITVLGARRGEGLGKATLAALEALLAREGVRELKLNVFAWNAAARGLYASSGYRTLEEDESSLRMAKRLSPQGP